MRRRILPATVVATLAVAGLVGCSQSSAASCVNPLQPGPLSEGVAVEAAGIDLTGPTDILNAQRSVLEAGENVAGAQPGDVVSADVTIYDAASGEVLDVRENAPHLALPDALVGEFSTVLNSADSDAITSDYLIAAALLCATPGETIALGLTPAQSSASQLSLDATVAVIDVIDVFPATATGAARGLPNGFPAVTTDESGRPGIVLPPQGAPSETRVATRIEGEGAEVTAESSVIGNVLAVNWSSGTATENTWESGLVGFGTEAGANPAYPFRELLTGSTAGSQLVILDPNDGDPIVYVVDIVAAA